MKAYIGTRRTDWVLRRVVGALERYAPDGVEIVPNRDAADLVVLHVIGRRDRTTKEAEQLSGEGRRYAVVQYVLRSTLRPDTSAWLPLWRKAAVVWSYLPLEKWCCEDWTPTDFHFYHAPLGVDTEVFYAVPGTRRKFVIATSGQKAVTESVREAAFATKAVDGLMFHLGPELERGKDIVCEQGLSDAHLMGRLNECRFVAGLRRTEGFELLAAEGLLCGARPVLFDREHYRQWHEPWGVFIPEGSRDGVIADLADLFRTGAEPVTEEEQAAAAELFDWEHIVTGFWDGCLD